jgi:hypothetical protein
MLFELSPFTTPSCGICNFITRRDASPFPCRTLQQLQNGVDQEATVPQQVPCGAGTAAFVQVMEKLGLEIPADDDDDYYYKDTDSHSDGDDDDDDEDDGDGDDGDARVIKNPRLVHCGDDDEMDAHPAAAVAVVVAGLHRPSPMCSANCASRQFVAAHHCKQRITASSLLVPQVLVQ